MSTKSLMPSRFPYNLILPILLVQLITLSPAAYAEAAPGDAEVGSDTSLLRCAEQEGDLEFTEFLSATTFSDGFVEAVTEPWVDVIFRNRCHGTDVRGLLRQQLAIRADLRDAYLTCDKGQAAFLEKRHHELNAEIYYVRHIVDAKRISTTPSETLADKNFQKLVTRNRNSLYTEMYKRYVDNGDFTEKDFGLLFLKLESKYADRISKYILCDESDWQQVEEKWTEFKENLDTITKDSAKLLDARARQVSNKVKNSELVKLVQGDVTATQYVASYLGVNIEALGIGKSLEDLVSGMQDTGKVYSQEEVFQGLAATERGHEIDKMRLEMSTQYKVLYGQASDQSVALFMETVDGKGGLNEVLVDSLPIIRSMRDLAEQVNDKECSE